MSEIGAPRHEAVPVAEADRLRDTVAEQLLPIDGWDAETGDVTVTTPDDVSVTIEGGLDADRYVPVTVEGIRR